MLALPDEFANRAWQGFLTIPDAVERLGNALFSDEWGTTPSFLELPYKLEEDEDEFEWKVLRHVEDNWLLRKTRAVARGPRSARLYSRSERLYWLVADKLVELVESEQISAKIYNTESTKGEIRDLPGALILSEQRDVVFFSGFVRHAVRPVGAAIVKWKRRLVLVDQKSLDRWIRRNIGLNPARTKPVSDTAISMAVAIVSAFAMRAACDITYKWLRAVTRRAAARSRRRLTDERFDALFWRALPGPVRRASGRQTNRVLQLLDKEEQALEHELFEALRGTNSSSSTAAHGPETPPKRIANPT